MTDPLTARLLLLLASGDTRRTAELISACPDVEGWQVRQTLDRLATDGEVYRLAGPNGTKRWRAVRPLNSTHSGRVREA